MEALKGKKTYIVAAIAILTALSQWATGDISQHEAIQLAVTALLGMTIRAGVAKK